VRHRLPFHCAGHTIKIGLTAEPDEISGRHEILRAVPVRRYAEAIGAAAAMVMPVGYRLLRCDEVLDYFCEIPGACSLPLGIYDNQSLRGASAEIYGALVKEARVSVSKDSSGDIAHVLDVLRVCGDRVLSCTAIFARISYGAAGVCTAIASIFPGACRKLYDLSGKERRWKPGNSSTTSSRYSIFSRAFASPLRQGGVPASQILGRPLGLQRKPLTKLPMAERRILRELLERHGHAID
jgi:dihydrodipicolinate synthase/N-acetylneuraminate lyase